MPLCYSNQIATTRGRARPDVCHRKSNIKHALIYTQPPVNNRTNPPHRRYFKYLALFQHAPHRNAVQTRIASTPVLPGDCCHHLCGDAAPCGAPERRQPVTACLRGGWPESPCWTSDRPEEFARGAGRGVMRRRYVSVRVAAEPLSSRALAQKTACNTGS